MMKSPLVWTCNPKVSGSNFLPCQWMDLCSGVPNFNLTRKYPTGQPPAILVPNNIIFVS